MAVKANASITVAKERDISTITRFYKIASSSSTPTQPSGTSDPSGWSQTEPAYDGTSTNSLYITDRTIFTDGTASWSSVSKSSSYEAAKQAYNEAQNAKGIATNYLAEFSNGVFVHASGTPSDPSDASARGVKITDVVDIMRQGSSVAQFGNTIILGQIDQNDSQKVYIAPDGFSLINDAGAELFNVKPSGNPTSLDYQVIEPLTSLAQQRRYYILRNTPTTGTTITIYYYKFYPSYSGADILTFTAGTAATKNTAVTGAQIKYIPSTNRFEIIESSEYRISMFQFVYMTANQAVDLGMLTVGTRNGANGNGSAVIGRELTAGYSSQVAIGYYNNNKQNDIFEIGNGSSNSASNSFEVDDSGNTNITGMYKIHDNNFLKSVKLTKDNITVSNSGTASGTISLSSSDQTNYKIIGTLGYDLSNASSSGTNVSRCLVIAIYRSSDTAITYQLASTASSGSKVKIGVYALVMAK